MFYSGEPYDLQCLADIRALYLEIPRESLRSRLARQDFPIAGNVGIGSGVGKLAAQLCVNLAAESRAITHADKARLGGELLNIVALALDRDPSGYGWRPASAGAAEPDPVLDRAASVRP